MRAVLAALLVVALYTSVVSAADDPTASLSGVTDLSEPSSAARGSQLQILRDSMSRRLITRSCAAHAAVTLRKSLYNQLQSTKLSLSERICAGPGGNTVDRTSESGRPPLMHICSPLFHPRHPLPHSSAGQL